MNKGMIKDAVFVINFLIVTIYMNKRIEENRKMTFEEFLEELSTAYLNPSRLPDGRLNADRNGHTRIMDLEAKYNLSSLKIQKLLVTSGVYQPVKSSSSYYIVKNLYEAGKSVEEIMNATGLTKAAVNSFMPYERNAKGLDKLGVVISNDAVRKRRQRSNAEMKKENARNVLAGSMSDAALWNALDEHCSECFITASGQRFTITVSYSGTKETPELKIFIINSNTISISQPAVFNAFHKALEEKAAMEVGESFSLGEYEEFLRPVFIYLGILDGDRNKVITRREVKEADVCFCCGRIGAPLYRVSSFSDLITLDEKFRKADREAWTEEQRQEAEAMEKHFVAERNRYDQKVKEAK